MDNTQKARIWITATGMTAAVVLYAVWIFTETPAYWETYLFVTALLLLLCAAFIRLVPRIQEFFFEESLLQTERIGERTYRRCGIRELTKIIMTLLVARLSLLLMTYLIRLWMFGYTETFSEALRIWLDFFHVDQCFPAYPLLSNAFWFVTFNFNHARFIASYLLVAMAGAALYYWVLSDHDRIVAGRVLRLFFLLPASCLLLGTLPDGLFLTLSLMSLVFLRKKQFLIANVFAMLATATHILGVLLLVPGIMEFCGMLLTDLRQHREERSGYLLRQIVFAASFLLIPLGFMGVLLYGKIRFGVPTALIRAAMEAHEYRLSLPFHSVAALVDRFLQSIHTLTGESLLKELGDTIPNLLYLIGGALVLLAAPGKIRPSYLLYMFITYISVLSTGTLLEVPRLLSLCVPFVLAIALLAKRKSIYWLLYPVFFSGLLLYLTAVVCGFTSYGM